MATLPGNAELPSKEASIFKNIVKHYEDKSYKKGIKEADKILKQTKYKEHGETQAMKGLILNNMPGKKEAAYELVRKGLRNNLRSHVCWHVYGLLHRSDRNYEEAIKSYLQALRVDPENLQILRDVGLLQIQMRQETPYMATRLKLLQLKSTQRANWIGYAMAAHLAGQHKQAVKVLDAYRDSVKDSEKNEPKTPGDQYERSEFLLYKNQVLREAGDMGKALAHLEESEVEIMDKLAFKSLTGKIKLQLGQFEDARKDFDELLVMNPDNGNYQAGLQCALCSLKDKPDTWTAPHKAILVGMYDGMIEAAGPKCYGFMRVRLDFLPADGSFKARLSDYIKRYVRRGIPSLLPGIKGLYADADKVAIIGEVFEDFLASLKATGRFPGADADSDEDWESPTVLVWTLCFLSQHNSKLRNTAKAMALIDEAIAHTPTIVEMYLVKARILKRGGDLEGASDMADYARKLDLQDRYLNTKGALYMFRADHSEEAEKVMSLFTKDGEQPDNLFDMQCMWYEIECGQSYIRQGLLGKALKKFSSIEKHYNDWVDDQFDFHSYCLRKMTLCAYVALLRFEDNLHSRRMYERAALAMINCYVYLLDNPGAKDKDAAADEFAHLEPKDRKKALSKKRRTEAKAKEREAAAEQAKKEKEEKEKGGKEKGKKAKAKEKAKAEIDEKKDEDPNGDLLLHMEAPKMLERAQTLLKSLQGFCAQNMSTHLAAFEVYKRVGKQLLVVQSLKRAAKLDASHAKLHECTVGYFVSVPSLEIGNAMVREVVDEEVAALLQGASVEEYNTKYIKAATTTAQTIAGAKMVVLIGKGKNPAKRAAKLLSGLTPTGYELDASVEAHGMLAETDAAAAATFKAKCRVVFPLATYFAETEEEA